MLDSLAIVKGAIGAGETLVVSFFSRVFVLQPEQAYSCLPSVCGPADYGKSSCRLDGNRVDERAADR
jgi:hypothetical protein